MVERGLQLSLQLPQVFLPTADLPCAYKGDRDDGVHIRHHGGAEMAQSDKITQGSDFSRVLAFLTGRSHLACLVSFHAVQPQPPSTLLLHQALIPFSRSRHGAVGI